MAAIFLRELVAMSRRRPFAAAAIVFTLLTVAFAASWPEGVPVGAGTAVLPQFALVMELGVAIVAPWIVCRCGSRDRGDNLVRLALFTTVRPSRILLSRFGAATAAVATMVLGTLPVLVYAQQASAVDTTVLSIIIARLGLVIAAVVAWAHVCDQWVAGYVGSWLAATAGSVGVIAAARLGVSEPFALSILAMPVAVFLGVAVRADVTSRYLAREIA